MQRLFGLCKRCSCLFLCSPNVSQCISSCVSEGEWGYKTHRAVKTTLCLSAQLNTCSTKGRRAGELRVLHTRHSIKTWTWEVSVQNILFFLVLTLGDVPTGRVGEMLQLIKNNSYSLFFKRLRSFPPETTSVLINMSNCIQMHRKSFVGDVSLHHQLL